jgi:carboxylate-amine ligase
MDARADAVAPRIPRRFGSHEPLWIGIEEELFVVDRTTFEPATVPAEILDGARRKPELFRSIVELTTTASPSAPDAIAELTSLRQSTAAALEARGLALFASGTHPTARLQGLETSDDPPLRRFIAYAGPAARTQFCCGLHVHVSVAGARDALRVLESVLPWLPLLLALSVNSPYLEGRETGYASTRAELLARLPRSGAPPVFRSFREWETYARRLVGFGLADDYTRIWWDVRPHPRLGTLEVRMPDQPTSVAVSAAFAALVQALVAASEPGPRADRAIYAENRFAALRLGAGARLIHPDGSRLTTVAELTAELLARVDRHARRLGSVSLLVPLERLARESQADAQRERVREGGKAPLLDWLREETTAGADRAA